MQEMPDYRTFKSSHSHASSTAQLALDMHATSNSRGVRYELPSPRVEMRSFEDNERDLLRETEPVPVEEGCLRRMVKQAWIFRAWWSLTQVNQRWCSIL